MKLVSKIIVILMVWVVSISAQSVIIDQLVRNLPIVNANGSHWAIYDIADAESRVCYENGTACITTAHAVGLFWSADIGTNNFPLPLPAVDDSLLIIGSWDSAYVNNPSGYGSNSNHTGFYWLYSDILHDGAYDPWPADTMRPLPKPIASQVGGTTGDILISITNPAETRYTGQTVYDVMGYWIWADTTGAGTPNAFNDEVKVMEVGFASVNGGPGETTIYSHPVSNYHNDYTVYWAYKLVARPDTVNAPGDTMGYSTYYFSQNSDPIVIIGIEENTNSKPECVKLEISPNPFTDRTDIRFQITENQRQDVRSKNQEASLEIYDCSGRLVKSFDLTSVILLTASAVPWYGTDESGELLPSGVYFIQAKGGDLNLTKKVILQR